MKGPNERVGELTSTDSDCSYLGEANCFASVQGEANSFASVQGEAKLLCFKVRQIALLTEGPTVFFQLHNSVILV